MCRNNRKRKYRVRWRRVFTLMILTLIISRVSNLIKSPKETKTENVNQNHNLTESTKENYTELNYATSIVEQDEVATEKNMGQNTTSVASPLELYLSNEITQSEKNSMMDFYSTGKCNDFEDYYSARLMRNVSKFEIYHLVRITYSESGNQGMNGKISVAATILNRMENTSFNFGNRIYDVIFQKDQFSSAMITDYETAPGKYFSGGIEQQYSELDPVVLADCLTAVKRALDGEDPTRAITGGALFFYNPAYCSNEELALRSSIPLDKIYIEEDHWFYREW